MSDEVRSSDFFVCSFDIEPFPTFWSQPSSVVLFHYMKNFSLTPLMTSHLSFACTLCWLYQFPPRQLHTEKPIIYFATTTWITAAFYFLPKMPYRKCRNMTENAFISLAGVKRLSTFWLSFCLCSGLRRRRRRGEKFLIHVAPEKAISKLIFESSWKMIFCSLF
jgi:hypothetical protein